MSAITIFLIDKYFEEAGFLDAAIRSFINEDLLFYLEGKYEKIKSMIYKVNGKIMSKNSKSFGEFKINTPLHNLFPKNKYWIPAL